jgi:ubiquinone/menaquinone biosynthesis C-methylase UbiE
MDRNAVRKAWDAVSEDYARNRNPHGNDADLLAELLETLPADPLVLDVGCGDGARTLANLPVSAVGLDFSRAGLSLARESRPNPLVQGDMVSLPFADGSFDAVTAYHAVFHVERSRHPEVYAEFARVLRPGGRVLTTVGTGAYQTTRRDWLGSGHAMFFSTPGKDRTLAQLRAAGFEVVWERFVDDPLGSSALFVCAELNSST